MGVQTRLKIATLGLRGLERVFVEGRSITLEADAPPIALALEDAPALSLTVSTQAVTLTVTTEDAEATVASATLDLEVDPCPQA